MDLLTLARLCGPWVDPAVTVRLIAIESAARPFVVHDNTAHRSFEARSAQAAALLARRLLDAHHGVDVGLMQINANAWLLPARVALARALEPCTNIRIGTTILSANYALAQRSARSPQAALEGALSLYHRGRLGDQRYVSAVLNGRPVGGAPPLRQTQFLRDRAQQAPLTFTPLRLAKPSGNPAELARPMSGPAVPKPAGVSPAGAAVDPPQHRAGAVRWGERQNAKSRR